MAWKRDSCRVVNPQFFGTSALVISFTEFWRPEKRLLPNRETHSSLGPRFVGAHLRHFGGMKMRILPIRQTHCPRGLSFVWAHFVHYGGLRMLFLSNRETQFKDTLARLRPFSAFWRPENATSAKLWNPQFKGSLTSVFAFWRPENAISAESWTHSCFGPRLLQALSLHFGGLKTRLLPNCEIPSSSGELIFCFLATCKSDFWRVVKTTFHEEFDSFEIIFCILAAWKCEFCRIVILTVQGDLALCLIIFCILEAWKCQSCRVVQTTVRGNLISY